MLWKDEVWLAADGMLRNPLKIYVAAPELWSGLCDEDWGYAYHLERWFHKFLMEHATSVLTQTPDVADFVYIPHCAMNVYFSWKQKAYQRKRSVIESLASESGASEFGEVPPAHGEGDLLHNEVLATVDASYLVGEVSRIANRDPAVVACRSRVPACRLLLVNMAFGRDDLPQFDAAFGRDTVFVTTAGARPRLLPQAHGEPIPRRPRYAGCSCLRHCEPKLSLGPLDVVVPFAIANNATSGRTTSNGKRDLLAVFAGSNTSCSRKELFERWASKATLHDHNMCCNVQHIL